MGRLVPSISFTRKEKPVSASYRSLLALSSAVLLSFVACSSPDDASKSASERRNSALPLATDVDSTRAQAQRDLILGEGAGIAHRAQDRKSVV